MQPPYVSASTRSVRRPAAASSAATLTATVVRPGAPVGPQTAATRPAAGRTTGVSSAAAAPASVLDASRIASASRTTEPPAASSCGSMTTRSAPRAASRSASQGRDASPTPTTRTPARCSSSTASRSSRSRSPDTTASLPSPASAAASSSVRSAHRLVTLRRPPERSTACTMIDSAEPCTAHSTPTDTSATRARDRHDVEGAVRSEGREDVGQLRARHEHLHLRAAADAERAVLGAHLGDHQVGRQLSQAPPVRRPGPSAGSA